MKILSNDEYKEIKRELEISENKTTELEYQVKKLEQFYELKFEDIYNNLLELNNSLKGNISKDKIKIKIQNILIMIRGKNK